MGLPDLDMVYSPFCTLWTKRCPDALSCLPPGCRFGRCAPTTCPPVAPVTSSTTTLEMSSPGGDGAGPREPIGASPPSMLVKEADVVKWISAGFSNSLVHHLSSSTIVWNRWFHGLAGSYGCSKVSSVLLRSAFAWASAYSASTSLRSRLICSSLVLTSA